MTTWTQALTVKYRDAIDYLERAVRECPEALWGYSLWTVRDMPPIRAGMGAELPAEERLQLYSAFWNVGYHVISYLDFYLSRGEFPFEKPPPFNDDHASNAGGLPTRMYTREELLGYIDHCRAKAESILPALTDDDVASVSLSWRKGHERPFAELLLGNLLHVWEHATQMQLMLGEHAAQ